MLIRVIDSDVLSLVTSHSSLYVSAPLMKAISILVIFVAAASVLNGCASDTTSSASAGDPVPGQMKSSEDRLAPGVGSSGPNASVKW